MQLGTRQQRPFLVSDLGEPLPSWAIPRFWSRYPWVLRPSAADGAHKEQNRAEAPLTEVQPSLDVVFEGGPVQERQVYVEVFEIRINKETHEISFREVGVWGLLVVYSHLRFDPRMSKLRREARGARTSNSKACRGMHDLFWNFEFMARLNSLMSPFFISMRVRIMSFPLDFP